MQKTDLDLKEGHVVLTGKVDGHKVSVEGDVHNVFLGVEEDTVGYSEVPTYSFSKDARCYLEFKTNAERKAFTVTRQMLEVEHVVTIYDEDATVERISQLARAAGVPEDASVAITYGYPKKITFTWTEKK